jgi:ribosome recycling factor
MDESKLAKVVDFVRSDLASISTGRARPALIEDVRVEAYPGSTLTIKELGSISTPDVQTILIQIWDQSVIEAVVKAIQAANLGLNPVVDQNMVRLIVPSLTTERRDELVKAVKQKVESGRTMLRQIRIELKKQIDDTKNKAGVSEDDIRNQIDELQELVDKYNGQLDELEQNKETELKSF